MDNNRVLSALCYFSIFFAGFLLPLIVYFVSTDSDVKNHAKRAFLSHLLLIIPSIIGFFIFFISFGFYASSSNSVMSIGPILIISFIVVEILLSLAVIIWNIIQGVRVLRV
ncbi:DUF4870 domain-containing protein [Viridibacillus sp. YIM B01967]|uniref:DUF4870 domain-containing protein n=1 Tax=Viridibacillus soli TaxID=2798301 RepID=A0ABS1H8N1_9BACL|nr:DUF4870 domain-containing protein [Viridibacillus soli]